jgi:hypothetical protein
MRLLPLRWRDNLIPYRAEELRASSAERHRRSSQDQHVDVEHRAPSGLAFQMLAGEMVIPRSSALTHYRMLRAVCKKMINLVADGRADEIGAVGIETFAHQQIDIAEINKPPD